MKALIGLLAHCLPQARARRGCRARGAAAAPHLAPGRGIGPLHWKIKPCFKGINQSAHAQLPTGACARGDRARGAAAAPAPGKRLGEQLALVPHSLEVEARGVQVEHALAARLRAHTAAPGPGACQKLANPAAAGRGAPPSAAAATRRPLRRRAAAAPRPPGAATCRRQRCASAAWRLAVLADVSHQPASVSI